MDIEYDPRFKELARRFPVEAIEKLSGFHYISIDAVINRFNYLFQSDWELKHSMVEFEPIAKDDKGRDKWLSTQLVEITLVTHSIVDGTPITKRIRRSGTGSHAGLDPDHVIKTAQANAFKKAANLFGVAQYLWSKEERDAIDVVTALNNGDRAPAVLELFRLTGIPTTKPDELIKKLKTTKIYLQIPNTLKKKLSAYAPYDEYYA